MPHRATRDSHRLPGFQINYPATRHSNSKHGFLQVSPAPLATRLSHLDFSIFQVCPTGYPALKKKERKKKVGNLPHRLPSFRILIFQPYCPLYFAEYLRLEFFLRFLKICPTGYLTTPKFTPATRPSNLTHGFSNFHLPHRLPGFCILIFLIFQLCPTGYLDFNKERDFRFFKYAPRNLQNFYYQFFFLTIFENLPHRLPGIHISYPAFMDFRIFTCTTGYPAFAF